MEPATSTRRYLTFCLIMMLFLIFAFCFCRKKTVDSIVNTQHQLLLKQFGACYGDNLESVLLPPSVPTFEQNVEAAKGFRDHVEKLCSEDICAVCSMYCPRSDIQKMSLQSIPYVSCLEVPPGSPSHLTTTVIGGRKYHLLAKAVDGFSVNVCGKCLSELKKNHVPQFSLVSFDGGLIPSDLEPLSMVEEQLLAKYRVYR